MDAVRKSPICIGKTAAKKYEAKVHPQIIIDSITLEGLSKCKFNIFTRETAIELHKRNQLIPEHPDIAIWTDGSLIRNSMNGIPIIYAGAAAIVHISNNQQYEQSIEHPIKLAIHLNNVVSSYETEIIAIQAGLDAIIPLEPS
jgi:hypothetical protein